jgi:beta-mannosidase
MKIAIEAHRRAKPYCMGTLYWQLNDCWPVTSWSSLDYYGNWKAFHYQAKRSYENLLISVADENKKYKIYLINDDLESYSGKLDLELFSFEGKSIWKTSKEITIEENSSTAIYEILKEDLKPFDLKQTVLKVKFNGVQSYYYFVKPKDLKLQKPNIQIKILNDVMIEISTDVLVKEVFLSSENETFFEDNYFDVLPNEKRIIKVSKVPKNVKVKSLFDAMK